VEGWERYVLDEGDEAGEAMGRRRRTVMEREEGSREGWIMVRFAVYKSPGTSFST